MLDLGDKDEQIFNVALESVLVQHQDAVSSIQWAANDSLFSSNRMPESVNDLYLLSSSFDFTVCLWAVDQDTAQWNVTSTLGAMTGNKHAYYGATFLDRPSERNVR